MLVREYRESDVDGLRKVHAAQNFPYAFPDLANPLFLTKIVLTDDDGFVGPPFRAASGRNFVSSDVGLKPDATKGSGGRILGAALLRLTAEAYLLLDPQQGSPRQRWQSLLTLHQAALHDAQQRGLEDVHAWLPPRIAKTFGRRIERLGWRRDDDWTPFCKRFYE